MTSPEEFNCILCKERFDNKDELQIHFRKHGDPKFNESIKTKSRNQNEAALANEKSNDASEMVSCDVCDEVFPTISKAITHKHKVHPKHDAKYFCPWCGKLFTMKHLYNKHLHTNHDAIEEIPENKDSQFHCDSCSVFFYIPAAMVYHNKFFHRQDTDLPIIGHSKKQKVVNQDLLPVYFCSFCGEEYINKVNLHKHICDDHGDENQRPTDVLRCPLCEAIFYHLDAYEVHLTFHSSEDLYIETNEMNEKELSEFSFETVPPAMERIEDLNNLPDMESGVNTIGIESFLQMAMDEPKDTGQPSEKKSKKHKKHKKSKKPAITLDEFLSMNQDVFGEDLDFQGIEEVPTKVIKKQFKVKKPVIPKKSTKFVSSADLQKLQKQGIVVKVPSGIKPPMSQLKPVVQPVKINQQVKNLASQTKTKTISASNEVLSKLLNQSSNQLKIVKKSVQEKEQDDDQEPSELNTEEIKDKPRTEKALESTETYSDEKEENITQTLNVTPCSSQESPSNDQDNTGSAADDHSASVNDESDETGNKTVTIKLNTNESNNGHTNHVTSHNIPSLNVSQTISPGNNMNNALKNISKQITIKSINPSAINSRVDEKSNNSTAQVASQRAINEGLIPSNIEARAEQNDASQKNKSFDNLKNLNSAITIKPLKQNVNKNSTSSNDKTENIFIQGTPESNPLQRLKLENAAETDINKCESRLEKSVHVTTPSNVLKNISKNITIKTSSPTVKHINVAVTSDENNDSDFDSHDDENPMENTKNSVVSSVPERLKILTPGQKFNSDLSIKSTLQLPCNTRVTTNKEENISNDGNSAQPDEMNTSNNLLKHLKNITAKPVPSSRNLNQEAIAKSINKAATVATENDTIKKFAKTKEISDEIEIYNIDDSDDEIEQAKIEKTVKDPIKFETTKSNSHAALNVIKNISKNITIKSPNNKTIPKEIITRNESNAETSDEDEMHDDVENNCNNDIEDKATYYNIKSVTNQKTTRNTDALVTNVLKNLGKNITIKSRNASPSPSMKSFQHISQDLNQETTTNNSDSDDEFLSSNVKITEITNEYDDDIGHTDNCDNTGIVSHSPEDSNDGDEQMLWGKEKTDEYDTQNTKISLKQNCKFTSQGLLKNISKNITIKALSERSLDNEDKTSNTAIPEKELIAKQAKLYRESSIKSIKQNKPEIPNDSEKAETSNLSHNKRMEGNSAGPSVNPRLLKPGVVNTVNKEVKLKTFQSETVIEEITTTVTKTIRRVNQTATHQVFNENQISPNPRMIKPNTGPRMTNIQSNNLRGVMVRQSTPGPMRPKIKQAIPYRPVASTVVRHSNQLVPIRPNITQIRPNNSPRMKIKNMPQQQPVGRPIKISPNVVNQTLKRPGNSEEPPGHFSCFKKPKESLIPGNETGVETSSDLQYACSSQMSKFCTSTQIVKGNNVTTTQMKSEALTQNQEINRLVNVSGLKVAKRSQVSQVEKTEINTSKRTALEAIEKLQKQGLLVKKPRVADNSDLINSDVEDSDQLNDDYYDE